MFTGWDPRRVRIGQMPWSGNRSSLYVHGENVRKHTREAEQRRPLDFVLDESIRDVAHTGTPIARDCGPEQAKFSHLREGGRLNSDGTNKFVDGWRDIQHLLSVRHPCRTRGSSCSCYKLLECQLCGQSRLI
jgi:hypothetical protein